VIEPLERRTLLSSAGAAAAGSLAPSQIGPIPTTTVLEVSKTTAVAAESVTLAATVGNANRNVPITSGRVKFVVDSPKHLLLGKVALNNSGEAGITTGKLTKFGTYQIEADYVPTGTRISRSVSAPVSVTVTPLVATRFLVTPEVKHGHVGGPLSFTVTALAANGQPVTNYAGTVSLSSPTDSFTIYPHEFYVTLWQHTARAEGVALSSLEPSSIPTIGLATFPVQQYTFTPADHGTHTFVDGITFGKAGAEVLKVTQANDAKIFGKTTFAIG
jgi:hypothetical protein